MSQGANDHEAVRELLSAELDGALASADRGQLEQHLAACAACRLVQREYAEQRRLLRGLPQQSPPRDLWARTSSALDRELARGGGRPGETAWRPRAAMVGSAAVLGLSLALVSTQLGLTPGTEVRGSPAAVLPTPISIAPQRIAFVGSDAGGLVLYRGSVDRVCPSSTPGCIPETDLSPQAVRLPADSRPANLSFSPDGERLAMTAHSSGAERVFALRLVDDDDPPAPQPTPANEPVDAPASPAIDHSPESPLPSLAAEASPQPFATPAAALESVAILEDVRTVGAPPSWSPSGEMLAFSAMPADARHGPDIYIWRPGDVLAQPLTNDHNSYFASWSGERIVVSRVIAWSEPPEADELDEDNDLADEAGDEPTEAGDEADGAGEEATDPGDDAHAGPDEDNESAVEPEPELHLLSVVVDPASGEERPIAATGLWLPVVSPLGGHAIAWQGSFELTAYGFQPQVGGLYLLDWRQHDPFASDEQPDATGEPTEGETDEDEPEIGGEQAELTLLSVEPERDTAEQPVLEWLVRWSSDGAVLGLWIADAPRSAWGKLSVLALDPARGELASPEALLQPTLARRSFSLGRDRIAWIGPSDARLEGELRVRTWGSAGDGDLRLPSFDLREVVLAF